MKINYNFSELENAMFNLKIKQTPSNLQRIKQELNKFFKDSKCKDLIYTVNTDKPFFGMCVMPYITGETAVDILTKDTKIRVKEYYIEIDSKLLEIQFNAKELTAMILHEVGHLVNDAIPVQNIKSSIDFYLGSNNQVLKIDKSVQYRDILAFGMKQALMMFTSLFKREDEEIIADQFSVLCGYGPDLESAYKKLTRTTTILSLNRGVPRLAALEWTLRLYRNVKLKRIAALHTINHAMTANGSIFQKRELANLERRLKQIDDHDLLVHESTNSLVRKVSDIYRNFKYKGIRTLEDDLYEINLRVKNCDEQDEALSILRAINTRMSLIDDYVNTEKLSEKEHERWHDLLNKYDLLRDTLSKKTVYDQKFYGLFVKTPVIRSRYDPEV